MAAPLASIDAMVTEAKRRWAARDMAGEVGFLQIHHVGDANSYVSIFRAGSDRAALVGEAFWVAWLLSMAHAFWRSTPVAQARINPAWREQSWTVAVLAIAAVVLNWATTGDHLIETIFTGTYWAVAGVDLSLLAAAALSIVAARRLALRERTVLRDSVLPDAAAGILPAGGSATHG